MRNVVFYSLKTLLATLSLLSLKALYTLAACLAPFCYRLIPKYRKRALSNLKLAKDLNLDDAQVVSIAKQSLFNLLLTALEYGKLSSTRSVDTFTRCLNPSATDALLDNKQGVIFLCGHQSNWELLFLEATVRHNGTCIGKPIKNQKLYNFILDIRQKFKGTVVVPKEAYKSCMKALRQGQFIGIVGDQGMPESSFSYMCMGRRASMTTLPALLALRSGCAFSVATIERKKGSYEITYSDPLVAPSTETNPIDWLTLKSLQILDAKIAKHPEQWMWQHNRWKIAYPDFIPKSCRHDAICIVATESTLPEIELLKEVR